LDENKKIYRNKVRKIWIKVIDIKDEIVVNEMIMRLDSFLI
jgi:hypothetical protein